jgi:O-antigen/teichoic acid export membrane protein
VIGQAPTSGVVRRSVVSLFVANSVSFATLGLSYLLYSRLLSPVQFGLYSTALVIGTFGQLILDGGLKNTIIKAPNPPDRDQQGTVVFLMAASSVVLVIALALGGQPIGAFYPAARQDYQFLAAFGALYLVSYPWLAVPTAFLERGFAYRRVAVIESVGQVLERATPALFLLLTPLGMGSFLLGLLLGRAFKVAAINLAYRAPFHVPTWTQVKDTAHLITEGGWLQLGTFASQLRDSLHVLIVGPLFGQAWVGYYGWCLQLALITSQTFVQISARVSVPVFAQSEGFETRWRHCLAQIRLLTILTAPVMMAALLVLPTVNAHLFHGKWQPALAILPLILLRMLPSLATTPVGALAMVHGGGRALAAGLSAWTAVELVSALVLSLLLGPTGLAWSYAFVVWIGLFLLLRALGRHALPLLGETVRAILGRPSLAIAVLVAGLLIAILSLAGQIAALPYVAALPPAVLIVAAAYLSEREVRRYLALARLALSAHPR